MFSDVNNSSVKPHEFYLHVLRAKATHPSWRNLSQSTVTGASFTFSDEISVPFYPQKHEGKKN